MKKLFQIPIVIAFVLVSMPAWALFMELDRPGLALPEGFPEESRKEIQQVLESSGCNFLGGSALNWNTTLRYSGSTRALTAFLSGLSNCEGTIIRISFVESLPQAGDWYVHHSAHEGKGFALHIRVNMGSDKINLSELVLPAIQGISKAEPASGGNR